MCSSLETCMPSGRHVNGPGRSIVVVEPDAVVARHSRPGYPQNPLETRVEMVAHLRDVAAVTGVEPGAESAFFPALAPFVWVTARPQRATDPYGSWLSANAEEVVELAPLEGCFTGDIIRAIETHRTPVKLPAGWTGVGTPSRGGSAQVTVNGCFDILHVGHLRFLEEARLLGDSLTVLINSDASVARYKGPTRPVFPEPFRMAALQALRQVDAVEIFSGDTPLEDLKRLKPGIHVKGGSYEPERVREERELIESWGGAVGVFADGGRV